MDAKKLNAAIEIAIGLFTAGTQILALLKSQNGLSDEDLLQIIDGQNKAQAEATARLQALIDPETDSER